ncbi:MAG: VOC family protein [Desulfobacterales bacterium]
MITRKLDETGIMDNAHNVDPRNLYNARDAMITLKSRNEVKMPPMRAVIYLELGDTVLEIISADSPEPKSEASWQVGYRGIALEVNDMKEAVDYLKSKAITIAREPLDLGDSYRGEIRDPDGLIIELRQWK